MKLSTMTSTRSLLFLLLAVSLTALTACDSGGDDGGGGASVGGDMSVRLESESDTEADAKIYYFDGESVNDGRADVQVAPGSPETVDLENGHDGYRIDVTADPAPSSLTLSLMSDGEVVSEDAEGERRAGGVAIFRVEGGEVKNLSEVL